MRPWTQAQDGVFRCPQFTLDDAGRRRVVFDTADGTHHGYDVPGGPVGALCSGAGINEAGANVPELRSPAYVAASNAAAAAAAAEATRQANATAAVLALWNRVKPPAAPGTAANVTNGEIAALLIILGKGTPP